MSGAKQLVEIQIVAHQNAQLVPAGVLERPGPGMVRGRTLVSLASPGTELNWHYLAREGFPRRPGYALVMEVEEAGPDTPGVAIGDRFFCAEPHGSHVRVALDRCVPVPAALPPETAVFCRLMAVSMTTMVTTAVRPPGRVLVTGLGPVGTLAARIFSSIGYQVHGFDLLPARRNLLEQEGIPALERVEEGETFDLILECSGHEEALAQGVRAARKGAEAVMIGVPWKKGSALAAHDILHPVFHRYIRLRSGWEWELPWDRMDFGAGSLRNNHAAALRWLAEGRVRTGGLSSLDDPARCQLVYQALLDRSHPFMTAVFDWRR